MTRQGELALYYTENGLNFLTGLLSTTRADFREWYRSVCCLLGSWKAAIPSSRDKLGAAGAPH